MERNNFICLSISFSLGNSHQRGWFMVNFWPKITPLTRFLFTFYWNKLFSHPFRFFFRDFVVLVRRCFVRRLCATLFVFLVSFRYLFDSVQIKSMTWSRQRCRSRDINIVTCVWFSTLSFYAINMMLWVCSLIHPFCF